MALHPLQLMRNGYPAGRPSPAQPSFPFVSRGLFRGRQPIRNVGVGKEGPWLDFSSSHVVRGSASLDRIEGVSP